MSSSAASKRQQAKKQYGSRSNLQGCMALFRDLLLLILTLKITLYCQDYWQNNWLPTIVVSVPLIWFVGALQFALCESLLHEASHGNLFYYQPLNRWVGNLIAFAIFTTLDEWKQEHAIHHAYLLSPQDHLSADYERYRLYDGLHPFTLWVLRPVLGVVGVQWMVSELPAVLKDLRKHVGVLLFYGAIALFCYFTDSLNILFWYWFVPLVWAYSSILYWSEVTDHYLAKSKTRSNRSVIWNGLFHNGGYHWLHHQYPFIPAHLLKVADGDLTPAEADSVDGWWEMYQLILKADRGAAQQ